MDRKKRLREIAHDIWVAEGYPVGQEDRHWRMAEQTLREEEERSAANTEKPTEEKTVKKDT